MRKYLPFLTLFFLYTSCSPEPNQPTLFTLLPADATGINFSNDLTYSEDFNPYIFKNFFNGGGVAIGDLNKDGLADLFFCGNMVDNKLYLNKGDFQFDDITEKAGVASKNVWSSGVSFADVNGDGWLDIYVCKSGKPGGELRHNELFISQGADETGAIHFVEEAEKYGIADEGLSAHAAFFDYDRDGDLDMYLLNNSLRPVGGFDIRPGLRDIPDPFGGNKLYRNELINEAGLVDQKTFTDVTTAANIYSSNIGYGLGVTIGDVNKDGWQDIHISNDFFERDYLYINNQDGTFKEDLTNQIREISAGSMGADMADMNNDAYPEIFVTDMLPETEDRYKSKMTFDNWSKYQLNVKNGYHHQFTRNVLQLNNGNNTFSEIGRLAGVHATDWSWSALLADFNNDGYKDIYVTNGIYQDLMDQDYINFDATDPKIIGSIRKREEGAILRLIEAMPSEKIPNYAFENNHDLTFSKVTKNWGLVTPSFSNGAAYGDLDNDGDLDLVVNNCNMPAFVYRNEATTLSENNYLSFKLKGSSANTFALGTQVTIYKGEQIFYQELVTSKGFQSSVDHTLHFGLGDIEQVDKVVALWPNGATTTLENIPTNQTLILAQEPSPALPYEGRETSPIKNLQSKTTPPLLKRGLGGVPTPILKKLSTPPISYQHKENNFSDFDRDRLLFQMISAEGPKMTIGDVNKDGLEDVFIGGAKGQAAVLFIQQTDGQFIKTNEALWESYKHTEDVDAVFFDADGDQDQDLYVARGSNEFNGLSNALVDYLFLNDGQGNFQKTNQILPSFKVESTSCVKANDFDQDGDIDLFVGVRLKPGVYGVPVNGYLLANDGRGKFTDVTKTQAPDLQNIGLITDAEWVDYDGDQDQDLIVVGEWMPITVFENNKGQFTNTTEEAGFDKTNGLWNCIAASDLDQDGDIDLVIGNHGLNSRFKASKEKPMILYVNDFDGNKSAEQIISLYNGDQSYPLALRHDLVMQLPNLKKKYLRYENYKGQQVNDIFSEKQVRTSAKSEVYNMASSIALNNGDGTFTLTPLPQEAQFSSVHSILLEDLDKDGITDILLGGNFYRSKPEVGIYDGSYGLVLKGNGEGTFSSLKAAESGFSVTGEIRDLQTIELSDEQLVLVARNDDSLLIYTILN